MCEVMDKDRLRVQHSCLVHETFCTLSRDGHFWPLLRVHEKYETHIFYKHERDRGSVMAQAVTSWFICDGRLRVHAINAVGRRSGRIIEIEDIDTGERVHGSARRLERLVQALRSSGGELDRVSPGPPDTTS